MIKASYSIIRCTVAFKDWDDTTLKSETVDYGTAYTSITKPADPTRPNYKFIGWADPEPLEALSSDDKIIDSCIVKAQYDPDVQTFEGYVYGSERQYSKGGTTTRSLTLPAGHKWRITLSDIHFCHGHSSSNHGLGANFSVGGTGISVLNRYITDDNRSTKNAVPTGCATAIYVNGNVGKDTENAYYPKSYSAYDSGYLTYSASSGKIGPTASEGTPGVQFIYETDTVTTETTLNIRMTAKAYKSSGCQDNTSTGAHCNAHYLVETIDE